MTRDDRVHGTPNEAHVRSVCPKSGAIQGGASMRSLLVHVAISLRNGSQLMKGCNSGLLAYGFLGSDFQLLHGGCDNQ